MKLVIAILLIVTYVKTDAASIGSNTTANSIATMYDERNVVYRGQHEIVKIYLPIFLTSQCGAKCLFVVEADRNSDGSTIDKGLYLKINDSYTKKLLDYGRDVDGDSLGNVYFAANDGVYVYDDKEKSANKYGQLNESIISVAVENNTGVIHALSENHVLYSISMDGNKVAVNERIHDAQEIAMSISDKSLFYYDTNKNVYVVTSTGAINKIEGIPKNASYFKMIKPPLFQNGMMFIVNNDAYIAFSNGTSTVVKNENKLDDTLKPTAYSLEAGLIIYHAYDKKVYETNLLSAIFSAVANKFAQMMKENLEALKNAWSG